MAEALFRRAVERRGEFRSVSAGIGAMDGQPPTPHSVRAMRELGVDISMQRSRMLTAELVRSADLSSEGGPHVWNCRRGGEAGRAPDTD